MVRNCRSVTETQEFAAELADSVPAGHVIALLGNLGSGKTTFAQGFASGLGIREHVGSPTFKLVSEYAGFPHNLHHVTGLSLAVHEQDYDMHEENTLRLIRYPRKEVPLQPDVLPQRRLA